MGEVGGEPSRVMQQRTEIFNSVGESLAIKLTSAPSIRSKSCKNHFGVSHNLPTELKEPWTGKDVDMNSPVAVTTSQLPLR